MLPLETERYFTEELLSKYPKLNLQAHYTFPNSKYARNRYGSVVQVVEIRAATFDIKTILGPKPGHLFDAIAITSQIHYDMVKIPDDELEFYLLKEA